MNTRVYLGEIVNDVRTVVYVYEGERVNLVAWANEIAEMDDPGIMWGDCSPGTIVLAGMMLLHASGSPTAALHLAPHFATDYLARLHGDFAIKRDEIYRWIERKRQLLRTMVDMFGAVDGGQIPPPSLN